MDFIKERMNRIMSKVYIFFADGFEDIEGLTVVDLMRRAGIDIQTVSINLCGTRYIRETWIPERQKCYIVPICYGTA